jgi:hypothetical protein
MRIICLALLLVLVACGEKPTGSTSATPVADLWLSNADQFIDEECGGVYDAACDTLFYYGFQEALIAYYGLAPSEMKECSLYPGTCTDPRQMELYLAN